MVYKRISIFITVAVMTKPELIPVSLQEIQVGTPVPFPVFDSHHTLLWAEGVPIQGESQLRALQDIGMFRTPDLRQGESGHGTAMASGRGNGFYLGASNFAQLKLQPGTMLHLRRSDVHTQGFVAVKLLGWLAEEDLLTSGITSNAGELPLSEGAPLEVKLLAGNGIVTFQSAVRLVCDAPYSYLHLAYPQTLTIRQLRKSLRASVSLPAQVRGGGEVANYDGVLGNLSASGCMLELTQLVAQVGDELLLTIALQAGGQEHELVLRTAVRNIRTGDANPPVVRYGLEFLNAGTADRLVIEHFIYQSLLEN